MLWVVGTGGLLLALYQRPSPRVYYSPISDAMLESKWELCWTARPEVAETCRWIDAQLQNNITAAIETPTGVVITFARGEAGALNWAFSPNLRFLGMSELEAPSGNVRARLVDLIARGSLFIEG